MFLKLFFFELEKKISDKDETLVAEHFFCILNMDWLINWLPLVCVLQGYGDNKPKSSTTAQEVKTLDGVYIEQVNIDRPDQLFKEKTTVTSWITETLKVWKMLWVTGIHPTLSTMNTLTVPVVHMLTLNSWLWSLMTGFIFLVRIEFYYIGAHVNIDYNYSN